MVEIKLYTSEEAEQLTGYTERELTNIALTSEKSAAKGRGQPIGHQVENLVGWYFTEEDIQAIRELGPRIKGRLPLDGRERRHMPQQERARRVRQSDRRPHWYAVEEREGEWSVHRYRNPSLRQEFLDRAREYPRRPLDENNEQDAEIIRVAEEAMLSAPGAPWPAIISVS
jgi:hypothetical protein